MDIVWAGVDVGGRRKGFHAATVDTRGEYALDEFRTPAEVVSWLLEQHPLLTAVDSPMAPAATGASCRVVERELVRAGICGIRWTPDRAGLDRNPAYYEWIEHGFELHAELRDVGLATIECFPTASWTRWGGSRGEFSRARWSSQVLQGLLELRPGERLNQDRRDALAAALTARAHPRGTECFGDIVVPLKPT